MVRDRILMLIDRLANGNKSKFAEMPKVHSKNIDDWVNKGHVLGGKNLQNLYSKLDVNINWLLTGEGEMFVKRAHTETALPPALTDDEMQWLDIYRRAKGLSSTRLEIVMDVLEANLKALGLLEKKEVLWLKKRVHER